VSRIVVGDTGPLLHLNEASAFHLLEPAGQILIPPVVSQELASRLDLPSWVNIEELNRSAQAKAREWSHREELDSEEAEAIALAMQLKSDWFLTDDALAREFSESLGLETHGSIGVLLWAVAEGMLSRETMPMNYSTISSTHRSGFPTGWSMRLPERLTSCFQNNQQIIALENRDFHRLYF